jgi:superkiller protein 3
VRADVNMVARLEDIRIRESERTGGGLEFESAGPAYAGAFRDYGLDVMTLGREEAAERVAASLIREQLVAALDDWAFVQERVKGEGAEHLWVVARLADADEWRRQFRGLLAGKDRAALERLASRPEALAQPPTTLVLMGRALARAKGVPAAFELLRRAQQRHPGDFWINHDLAHFCGAMKPARTHEAIGFFRAALALRPRNPDVHNNLGNALQEQGKLAEAVAAYREAIRLKPNFPEAHTNLGAALEAQGKVAEAVTAHREALRLKPDFPGAYTNLGGALQAQGKVAEAVAAHREAIRLKPDYPQAHTNLGSALQAQGKVAEAVAAHREAIRLKPDFPQAHYNLGNALHKQRKLAEAVAAFQEALRLKADYPEAHNNLGLALQKQGKPAEAVAAHREALRLKADYPEAHNNLGLALHKQGKVAEAVAAYKEAIRLKPDFPEAHTNLGNALHHQGKLAEAVAAFNEALRLKPDLPEAHFNLGNALHHQGKLTEAVAAYQEAIRLKPDFPEAHNNLGAALSAQGKLAEAVAAHRKAIRLKPDNPEAHYNLGVALRAQGKPAEAVAAYKEAIRLKPDLAEAHFNLGLTLEGQGKFREALAALRKGHELGCRRPGWPSTHSAAHFRQVERLAELDQDLPAFLAGKRNPSGPGEQLELAALCRHPARRRYAASARFYAAAFAAKAALAEDLRAGHRYNAACVAALAGGGQGEDAAKLDDKERGRLRRQAVDWLRADLALRARQLDSPTPQALTQVQRTLRHWQRDHDLAGLREAAALTRLPAEEQEACRKLWADVGAVLERAGAAQGPPER